MEVRSLVWGGGGWGGEWSLQPWGALVNREVSEHEREAKRRTVTVGSRKRRTGHSSRRGKPRPRTAEPQPPRRGCTVTAGRGEAAAERTVKHIGPFGGHQAQWGLRDAKES